MMLLGLTSNVTQNNAVTLGQHRATSEETQAALVVAKGISISSVDMAGFVSASRLAAVAFAVPARRCRRCSVTPQPESGCQQLFFHSPHTHTTPQHTQLQFRTNQVGLLLRGLMMVM